MSKKKSSDKSLPNFQTLQELLRNSPLSQKRLGDLCKYECGVCKEPLSNLSSVYNHVDRTGHIKDSNKKTLVLTTVTKASSHRCIKCGRMVLCDLLCLRSHLKSHKISIERYCAENGLEFKKSARNHFMAQFLKERASRLVMSENMIGNSCSYACHLCKRSFRMLFNMKQHMELVHKLEFSSEQIAHNLMQKIVVHKCQLCSKQIICERSWLKAHFLSRHQINSLEDYCKLTGCKLDTDFKAEITTKMGSLCTWSCKRCPNLYWDRTALARHQRKEHGEQRSCAKDAISLRVLHQCHLCLKKVLCDLTTLYKHYNTAHGTKGLAYFKAKSKEDKDFCRKYKKDKNCRSCVRGNFQALLSKSTLSKDEIGNLCRYQCHDCGRFLSSHSAVSNHVLRSGHMKEDRKGLILKTISESVVHPCKICNDLVRCDVKFLRNHFKREHGMSLKAYSREYDCILKDKSIKYCEKSVQQEDVPVLSDIDASGNSANNGTDVSKTQELATQISRECRVVLHDIYGD